MNDLRFAFRQLLKNPGIAFVDGILHATINLEDRPRPAVNHALGWYADKGASLRAGG